MKLMNIFAVIAISGVFGMATINAMSLLKAGDVCVQEHKACKAAGKSDSHCMQERDKCNVDVMHGRR